MEQKRIDGKYYVYTETNTPEDNELLIKKVARSTGNEKETLAWELAEKNFPLIIHVINKYFSRVYDRDSMISDGTLALFKACKNVQENTPNKKFTTYVCKCISGKIIRGLKKRSSIVKQYKKDGVEHRPESMSLDAIDFDLEDKDFHIEDVLIKSDGDYCGEFIDDVKKYYVERKTSKHQSFFDEKTENILEGLKSHDDTADIAKKYGMSKQRIDQIKQSMFIYAVQTLRDSSDDEKEKFFDVIYKGKYGVNNPPPLKGWRKDFWDLIFESKDYKTHTNYKKRLVEQRKVEKI